MHMLSGINMQPTLKIALRKLQPLIKCYRFYRLRFRHKAIGCIVIGLIFLYYMTATQESNKDKQFDETPKYRPNGHINLEIKRHGENDFEDPECSETTNFVYIKAIKCASSTLSTIFRKFGYERDLEFVLPPGKQIYLGWPYEFQTGFYREKKSSAFNILCEHAVYSESVRRVMPEDAVYITSIRQPFSQFKSMFNYYNLAVIVNLAKDEERKTLSGKPFREYVTNFAKYDSIYKSAAARKKRFCIPDNFSMSKNLMSFTLGYSQAHSQAFSSAHARAWLQKINREFSLVIIVEHFEESMILLRRMFCWTWRDVMYLKVNSGNYTYKKSKDSDLEAVYKAWSPVDYMLYDHFNATLWRKITAQQNVTDYWREVRSFKKVLQDVKTFCDVVLDTELDKDVNEKLYNLIPPNHWSPGFIVKKTDCQMMADDYDLLVQIKNVYDKNPTVVNQIPAPKKVC